MLVVFDNMTAYIAIAILVGYQAMKQDAVKAHAVNNVYKLDTTLEAG